MATPAEVASDTAGRLAADLFCASCGHNLRGLEPSGICTECGSLVKWSLGDGTLRFGDPQWIRKLRSGVTWVTLMLPWLWFPLSWPLFVWGFWRLTTRAPQEGQTGQTRWSAFFRAALLAVPALALMSLMAVESLQPWSTAQFARFALALTWVSIALLITLAARRLGQQTDSERLRRLCATSTAIHVAALALLVVGAASELLGLDAVPLIAATVLGGLATTVGVLPFVIMLFVTWGELEAAEIHTRAVRREVRPWLRPEPGSSFLKQASRG